MRSGRHYLYSSSGSRTGTSLGPRSPKTELRFEEFQRRRESIVTNARGSGNAVAQHLRLYRATRLLAIGSQAAAILRMLDERRMLDETLLVLGTSTMAAYEMEAAARFAMGLDRTHGFSLTWAGRPTQRTIAGGRKTDATLFAALKRLDPTFTINTERTFQARNSKAYEVDLLVAPSQAGNISRDERLRPLPLPEQEWLLMGRRVDQVAGALDGTAARIVAPDPRWMALHKLWLAEKATRDPLKRDKDRKQGLALLDVVRARMPHYPIDAAFERELPAELAPHFAKWRDSRI